MTSVEKGMRAATTLAILTTAGLHNWEGQTVSQGWLVVVQV